MKKLLLAALLSFTLGVFPGMWIGTWISKQHKELIVQAPPGYEIKYGYMDYWYDSTGMLHHWPKLDNHPDDWWPEKKSFGGNDSILYDPHSDTALYNCYIFIRKKKS